MCLNIRFLLGAAIVGFLVLGACGQQAPRLSLH
jgi:hypothetical protein